MSDLELFRSHLEQRPWQWAKKQRRWFTTPQKDAIGGAVGGVIAGASEFFINSAPSLGRAVLAAVVGTVAFGLLMPILEGVYWRLRRNQILLDEAQAEIRRLEGELSRVLQKDEEPGPILTFKRQSGTARTANHLRSADLVIENSGGDFVLIARCKLVAAAPGMEFLDADEWEYIGRMVDGGMGRTVFHIATVREVAIGDSVVTVVGEMMRTIHSWRTSQHPELWFDVKWTLLKKNLGMLSELAVVTTHVKLAADGKTFDVDIRK